MVFPNLHGRRIVLASQSPRRQELVRGLEIGDDSPALEIRLVPVDESWPNSIAGPEVAEYVTRKKAEAHLGNLTEDEVLITGDTVVVLDGIVLEKPADSGDAKRMLRLLSGRTHTVASGIAVTTASEGIRSALDTCEVSFATLDDGLISHYVERYKPFDKAGGYGVQDLIGFAGVTRLEGSFYTVMGLPMHILYRLLREVPPL
jgi:septum formation protein